MNLGRRRLAHVLAFTPSSVAAYDDSELECGFRARTTSRRNAVLGFGTPSPVHVGNSHCQVEKPVELSLAIHNAGVLW